MNMAAGIKSKSKLFFLIGAILFVLPLSVSADYAQQKTGFSIEPSYDSNQREQLTATLQKITPKLYFYIDNEWWETLDYSDRNEVKNALTELGQEFEGKIYPTLTSVFGKEWIPGVDKDERITVLLHPMKEGVGGYFNNIDEYPRLQAPNSNEREMVYLNANYITGSLAKSYLAHEFVHLVTFNQKDKTFGVTEEVWLNEARAELAITLVGYNQIYEGSNLQKRVRNFLDRPYDSLTEWYNTPYDYGVVNLFTHYLVDNYGVKILTDSLQSSKIGIPSLNYALEKNGFKENFSQIFTDWTIAVLVNDCSLGAKYCYKNPNLKNFRVIPLTNFLPLLGESTLRVSDDTKDWSGSWYRITGGRKTLKIEFTGSSNVDFKIPYVIQDVNNNIFVDFLKLNNNKEGTLYVPDFGIKFTSLTIIPLVQTKISGFDGLEPSFRFSWAASTIKEIPSSVSPSIIFGGKETEEEQTPEMTREELLTKINEIQNEINRLKIQLIRLLQQEIIKIQNQIAESQ